MRNVRTLIQLIGVQHLQVLHASGTQLFQQHIGQLVIGLGNDFTGFSVNNIFGNDTAQQEIFWHADAVGFAGFQFTGMTHSDALVFRHNHFARLVSDVKAGDFPAHALGDKFHLRAAIHEAEVVEHKEVRQNGFVVQANGLEQNRDRHFAATVYTDVQNIFRVKLEVEP